MSNFNFSQEEILSQLQKRSFTEGPAVVFRWQSQKPWTVEYVSENIKQWGYKSEDFLNGNINYQDIIYAKDVSKIVQEIENYKKKGIDSYVQNYRIICKNGEIRWVRDYCLIIRNSDGFHTHYEGYVLDITEQKKGEWALQESEEKFTKAFQFNPNPMAIAQVDDYCFVDTNINFLKIFGYSRNEIIEKRVSELNLWLCKKEEEKVFQKLNEQKSIKNLECEFISKWSNVIVGLFSAEFLWIKNNLHILFIIVDITAQKEAEKKLILSAKREKLLGEIASRIRQSLTLKNILETTVKEVRQFLNINRVYIIQFNKEIQGRVIAESVDNQSSSVLGWKPHNDKHIQEIINYFSIDKVYAFDNIKSIDLPEEIRKDFLNYQICSFLTIPIFVDNNIFGYLIANSCYQPHPWAKDEIDFIQQLAIQISIAIQQGKLYEEVQNLNNNLEELVKQRTEKIVQQMQELKALHRTKNAFLHAFSHDLRTPIMGTALVLKSLLSKKEDNIIISRSILERLQEGSDRQLKLINSLLEAHTCEISELILNYQRFNIYDFIQNILADLEPLTNKYCVQVQSLLDESLQLLYADPLQLRRVFENLITNSFKYNSPGIIITLKVVQENNCFRFIVEDNGRGISLEDQQYLFDLYYRGSHNRISSGIGIGLYLCSQIIKAHGGEIGVDSEINQGARFWFTLPTQQ
ncbi:MAG: GAF domain-containing protein [Geminocystis sp.]|uniref:histidine kinase n=1 Tax=Cyanobacterium aponinum 0216 TaxID=2676140 RepID=A0A844GUM4_9CHRO|nr:ATP-binding protein [Cyanobacterium aponinum]MTF39790.1 PAS domain S-box protein [Cyanobacterium aponinum 0216]